MAGRTGPLTFLWALRASVAQNQWPKGHWFYGSSSSREDGEPCRRWRQGLRLESHGGHPAALSRRPIPWIGLDRPTRPLTDFWLLEPEILLLPRDMAVRSGARRDPYSGSRRLAVALYVPVWVRGRPARGRP